MSNLTLFVQAVGADIKALNAKDKQFETELGKVDAKLAALKNEIFGGEVDESLDTFFEIIAELRRMKADDTVATRMTEKLAELKAQIDAIKDEDLVQVYNTAKGV